MPDRKHLIACKNIFKKIINGIDIMTENVDPQPFKIGPIGSKRVIHSSRHGRFQKSYTVDMKALISEDPLYLNLPLCLYMKHLSIRL